MILDIDKKNLSAPALRDDSGRTVTYGALAAFCEEARGALPPRSVAFCLCENGNGCAAMILGCLSAGVVPLLLSADIDPLLLDSLAERYAPGLWVLPKDRAASYPGRVLLSAYGYLAVLSGAPSCPVHPGLALLMTTSGSTGSPRLVRCALGGLEANARNVAAAFGWKETDVAMCHLPVQYTMGLNHLLSHLAAGALAVLTKHRPTSAKYWEILKKERCTDVCGVPFNYEVFLRLRIQRMDLPDLRTLASGGGKLKEEQFRALADYAAQTGRRFVATFGTTETNARMALLDPDKASERILSIGKAIPGGELLLLDDAGRELTEPAAEGELAYRGPNVAMGYAECREDLLLGDEWKGFFRTGDLARRDEDGFYYVTGRKSRFLKLYGLRVSLDQCERLLESHFPGRFACTGTDERVDIFCGDEETSQKARAFLAQKTGIPVRVFRGHVLRRLPMTESGKIRYSALCAMTKEP